MEYMEARMQDRYEAFAEADLEEAVARRIYEDAHKGMRNIWGWDDGGLQDEHPGTRERFLGYARSAIAATAAPELLDVVKAFVVETVDYATLNKLGDPEQQHNVKWARAVIAKAEGK